MKFRRQKPSQELRRPQSAGSANVFSYYASRAPVDNRTSRQNNNPALKSRTHMNWRILPSLIALLAILFSFGYLLWIDLDPRIEVISNPESSEVLHDKDVYRTAGKAILARSPLNRFKVTIDTNKIAHEFKTRFPELTEVAITTPVASHRLVFEIQPATPKLVMTSSNSRSFIIDERGRALIEATDVSKHNLPIVLDESGITLAAGKTAFPSENIRFISELGEQLRAKNISIGSMSLPTVANELHLKPADAKYYIKFNLTGDARLQAGMFIATHAKLVGQGKLPSEYMDVRTPEKVFYR